MRRWRSGQRGCSIIGLGRPHWLGAAHCQRLAQHSIRSKHRPGAAQGAQLARPVLPSCGTLDIPVSHILLRCFRQHPGGNKTLFGVPELVRAWPACCAMALLHSSGLGRALLVAALLHMLAPAAVSAAPSWQDWGSRAVYQIVTDRFAAPALMPIVASQGKNGTCSALNNYCGGTWQGILDQLDYIQGLNLNAIWASPVSVQSYGGYHGYWPTNLYSVNPAFGTPEGLQAMLHELARRGMYNVLDVVANHVGYGSSIFLPAFNPFGSPEYFHDCTGCAEYCDIPDDATFEQQWHCQLSGLPDLNQTHPFVRAQFADWLSWMLSQHSIHMLRMDAAGHVNPEFWPFMVGSTELVAWLEIGGDPALEALYEKQRGSAQYSYQSWILYEATVACFAQKPASVGDPDAGCRQISAMRTTLTSHGEDLRHMGTWCENHDTDRFLTIRNDTAAYRNALAQTLLSDSIPIIYYGAEQGMAGALANNTNRSPLWELGFSNQHPLYIFIRTLAWYRWWMTLGAEPLLEHYVDRRNYVFSRGKMLLAVLTAGNYTADAPRPATYNLTGLEKLAGKRLCDALRSGYCVDVAKDGSASVATSPADEPMVLVAQSWIKPDDFFTPLNARAVLWQQGLTITLIVPVVALLIDLIGRYALHCWSVKRCAPLADARAALAKARRPAWPCRWRRRRRGTPGPPASPTFGGDTSVGKSADSQTAEAYSCLDPPQSEALDNALLSLGLSPAPSAIHPMPNAESGLDTGTALAAAAMNSAERGAANGAAGAPGALHDDQMSFTAMRRLDSLRRHKPSNALHALVDCLQADPGMVMHVALEYAVPHLGMTSSLKYGGLGQVVETFIRHTNRPILVCAPMYAPFYRAGLGGAPELGPELAGAAPVLSLPAVVGDTKHLVDVYVTASPGTAGHPVVFYLLLAADIFATRTRAMIYQHASEAEELTFFSIFNQTVAHVVETLGVQALQIHDYHGALSLMYLPPQLPLRVLLVAHNADYNGTWHLGTPEREAWVYSMLNIPLNTHTRTLCEHSGQFNMLSPVLRHMQTMQQGLGVVAVSPRYAIRAGEKFSMFWALPPGCMTGILNGLEDNARPRLAGLGGAHSGGGEEGAVDLDTFFARKLQAKLGFQAAKGLQVGAEHRLLVFLGRITHQKGCDLIALAARDVLHSCRTAQIAMVGPIGDEYGEEAKTLLEKVSGEFPGRVWNGAGQYIAGTDKEQLCMAADFFLCPSRFEPCGLADIEFAWKGAVMVGHNTGGLGKCPGFYYEAELDSVMDQSIRLGRTALRALRAPEEELRRLATEALQTEFPPARMVKAYDKYWHRLARAAHAPAAGCRMTQQEAGFYERQWLEDNTPYNPKTAAQRAAERAAREFRAWASNLLLILLQAVLQVPSMLSLMWYTNNQKAGSIEFQSESTWGAILSGTISIYFYAYAGSAILFQALAFWLSPQRYMRMAACLNVTAVLLLLWSLWAPQAAQAIFLCNAVTSTTWGPICAFIFLDLSRASVSQHGPAVMGYADMLHRTMSVVAVWSVMTAQGDTNVAGYRAAGIVFYVIACLFVFWLMLRRSPLPPHFAHMRLRLRGQASLLLRQRRAWLASLATTTLDSFGGGFILSAAFDVKTDAQASTYMVAYFVTMVVTSIAVGLLLTVRLGRRLGLKLMYALAALPGVVLVQWVLIELGGTAAMWVAATVVGALTIRTNVVGLLTLHTLPTRETFTLVKTLQVSLGSLAIVVGLAAGATVSSVSAGLGLAASYEALRLLLVAVFVVGHRRENIAKP